MSLSLCTICRQQHLSGGQECVQQCESTSKFLMHPEYCQCDGVARRALYYSPGHRRMGGREELRSSRWEWSQAVRPSGDTRRPGDRMPERVWNSLSSSAKGVLYATPAVVWPLIWFDHLYGLTFCFYAGSLQRNWILSGFRFHQGGACHRAEPAPPLIKLVSYKNKRALSTSIHETI